MLHITVNDKYCDSCGRSLAYCKLFPCNWRIKEHSQRIKSLSERIKEAKYKAKETITGRYVPTRIVSVGDLSENQLVRNHIARMEKRWEAEECSYQQGLLEKKERERSEWVLERVDDCIYALESEGVSTWAITSKANNTTISGGMTKGRITIHIRKKK